MRLFRSPDFRLLALSNGLSSLGDELALVALTIKVFELSNNSGIAVAAVSEIGATPAIRAANGGLDANWMVRHGIPTVTFGAGQNEPHTTDEWINLDEYDRACALALQLATMR